MNSELALKLMDVALTAIMGLKQAGVDYQRLIAMQEAAAAALRQAQPVIARSGQLGVIHANNASRKVSRLAKRVKAMS